jgi:tetrapyrrole methylase family protein/MazG family protein
MLVAQCDSLSVLSEIKLAVDLDDPPDVTVLQGLGTEAERIGTVAWADLDRDIRPDHLTSLWIPPLAAPVAGELQRFADLVATLRRECPWDREQTHQSLTRHLIEESYEVLEAIDRLADEPDHGFVDLQEELGDLLFQVFFHATLAAESGEFTLAEVARGIHDKLVLRHPHVFGEVAVDGADDVVANWEAIKKREKGRESVFDGIPKAMPALLRAQKVLRKGETLGPGGPDPDELIERAQAVVQVPDRHAVGALLLTLVSLARRAGVDPEEALRQAIDRLEQEFRSREGQSPR